MSDRTQELADVIEQLINSVQADEEIAILLAQRDWAEVLAALRLSPAHEDQPSAA